MKNKLDLLVKGKQHIAVGGHFSPDGDCTGAAFAIFHYLKTTQPLIKVDVFLEKVPDYYSIIDDVDLVIHNDNQIQYDLFIAVDCDENRLGFSRAIYERAKETVNIDHHISNASKADVVILDVKASSTCELVYRLLDPTYISDKCASCLYIGIIHDTGVFRYPSTTAETMRIVANLMETGINTSAIARTTFFEKTIRQNQILGYTLLNSNFNTETQIISVVLSLEELKFFQVLKEDLDGIVSQLLLTKDAEVAIFMYEINKNKYKVSLRSVSKIDVSKVASFFGGGGHIRASGIFASGDKQTILKQITEQIQLQA